MRGGEKGEEGNSRRWGFIALKNAGAKAQRQEVACVNRAVHPQGAGGNEEVVGEEAETGELGDLSQKGPCVPG